MDARRTGRIVVVGAALLIAGAPVWAHHAMIAEFALNKPITLQGTVTKLEWKNPHGFIHVDVAGTSGQVDNWAVETGSVYNMTKRGLKKTDLIPGTKVIIGGWAAKDGTLNAAGWIVTFPDREGRGRESSFSLGR
jgi:hypothetical protein